MAKGISLHIGLNAVDPMHYDGWDGTLNACEFDANDMQALAKKNGFTATPLLTKAATSTAVIAAITAADVGDTWGGGGPMLASTQFAHIGFMTKLAWYLRLGTTQQHEHAQQHGQQPAHRNCTHETPPLCRSDCHSRSRASRSPLNCQRASVGKKLR